MSPHHRPPPPSGGGIRSFLSVFRYSRRAIRLVWETSRGLTLSLSLLTLLAGLVPASIAWVGKLIVDTVVLASQAPDPTLLRAQALRYVALEGGLVALLALSQRGLTICQSLLRALLSRKVNVLILEKAQQLSLEQFEDSEFYDKLTRARRDASTRPLSLVNRTFALIQGAISLISYGGLLLAFSGWAVLALVVAGLPAFVAETKFSGEAFRLFKWRAPESRERLYLEWLLAREDYAKEVMLYRLGPMLLKRYRAIYDKNYGEDRSLTLRRGGWGYALGLLSTTAFYGAYGWIAWTAIQGTISLGEMTMYLLVFKQGQAAFSASLSSIGGMYEDNLYLSNLYEYLEQPAPEPGGSATQGPTPGDGVRFEEVSFTYPGADRPALEEVSLHVAPGQKLALVGHNGSGKTTLIKLLTRLYEPTEGRILLDGLDVRDWDRGALRDRIGVIFQDFVRFQMLVGQNIGMGDVDHLDEEPRWRSAAEKGLSSEFIEELPEGYQTQLGRWFSGGRELSLGQWQKVALSRAFMREQADVLILDEPTAAMDPEAEMKIFDHFREVTRDQMAILISHRFSTVRQADRIAVLHQGKLVEHGSHQELMARHGQYHHLFSLQARGYLG